MIFNALHGKINFKCDIGGVRAIKVFNNARKITLISIVILVCALVLIARVPELPSSKPITPGMSGI